MISIFLRLNYFSFINCFKKIQIINKKKSIKYTQTENSGELNERLSESSTTTTPAVEVASSEDATNNEVAVNYTITSPLRKTLRSSVDKEDDNEQKISATFTISPPPRPSLTATTISSLANRLEKNLDLETESNNSVTATINVPLIANKIASTTLDSDRTKKTDNSSPTSSPSRQRSPPIAQPRSLFDIDNASSIKLADKFQQEAKKCDANSINDGTAHEASDVLPPSPIHTIFGERRPSWRFKCDYSSKVMNDFRSVIINSLLLMFVINWHLDKLIKFQLLCCTILFSINSFFHSFFGFRLLLIKTKFYFYFFPFNSINYCMT